MSKRALTPSQTVIWDQHRKHPEYDIFFETGTGEADTLSAVVEDSSMSFRWHFSCEVDPHQYWKAHEVTIWEDNVTLVCGPSDHVMPRLLPYLADKKVMFWLDAHHNDGHELYGAGCPTMVELGNIEALHPEGNLILIDDAHLFGVDPAYPTPEDLGRWVRHNEYDIERVENVYVISRDE